MSYCYCKNLQIRISTDEIFEIDGKKVAYVRCCLCSGKWGHIDLSTGIITKYETKTKNEIKNNPIRYISKSIRYEVLKRQKWCCNICGKHLKYSDKHSYGDVVAHIDHIIPFSQWETYDGYINELSNLEALCPDCNMKKHSKNGF